MKVSIFIDIRQKKVSVFIDIRHMLTFVWEWVSLADKLLLLGC